MKSILVIISLILGLSPAKTKENCNRDVLQVSAAWFRAAAVCHQPNWLSRPANFIADEEIIDCDAVLGEPEATKLMAQGMNNFDEVVKTHGQEVACKMVDQQMIETENSKDVP